MSLTVSEQIGVFVDGFQLLGVSGFGQNGVLVSTFGHGLVVGRLVGVFLVAFQSRFEGDAVFGNLIKELYNQLINFIIGITHVLRYKICMIYQV